MADDMTGKSVDELRAILQSKQEQLQGVRADRLAAEQEKAKDVVAAQLRAEIARVDGNIQLEVEQLKVSQNQDPDRIGAGTLTLDQKPDEVTDVTPPVPETPEVTVPTPVVPEGTPSNEGGKK